MPCTSTVRVANWGGISGCTYFALTEVRNAYSRSSCCAESMRASSGEEKNAARPASSRWARSSGAR